MSVVLSRSDIPLRWLSRFAAASCFSSMRCEPSSSKCRCCARSMLPDRKPGSCRSRGRGILERRRPNFRASGRWFRRPPHRALMRMSPIPETGWWPAVSARPSVAAARPDGFARVGAGRFMARAWRRQRAAARRRIAALAPRCIITARERTPDALPVVAAAKDLGIPVILSFPPVCTCRMGGLYAAQ